MKITLQNYKRPRNGFFREKPGNEFAFIDAFLKLSPTPLLVYSIEPKYFLLLDIERENKSDVRKER